eukprot:SAG22_NODE_1045_length_5866_cov_1.781516_1_plen_142_part_00
MVCHGGLHCRQRIAAFLLGRGDYAWMVRAGFRGPMGLYRDFRSFLLLLACAVALSAPLSPRAPRVFAVHVWPLQGYNWMGCAGSDHKRKYFPFPGGPYKCPQNASLECAGYVDGARWQAPPRWDPHGAMNLDMGDGACRRA